MDNASLRRGKKPTHLVYGEDQALLAGMALIAEANLLISARTTHLPGNDRIEMLTLLNRAFSLDGLSGGQSEDLRNATHLSLPELEFIHARKTGALSKPAPKSPRSCAGPPDLSDSASRRMRAALVWPSRSKMTCSTSNQKRSRVNRPARTAAKPPLWTWPGSKKSKALYEELLAVALKNLEPFGDAADHVRDLTAVIQSRKF